MTQTSHMKHVYMIAGEESGDLLGGRLMAALHHRNSDLKFSGIGGLSMTQAGMASLFPMEDLSVMGVAEVLPKLFTLIKRINQTVQDILNKKPDVVVTIDSPDFCFRVVKKLRKAGYQGKCVHYVAPSVWAWRAGRAKKLAKIYDHVLCLLPFEPPYFEKEGMGASFIGHSIIESDLGQADGHAFRQKYGLSKDEPLLCVLPGSRGSELKQLLPVFTQTCQDIEKDLNLRIIVPSLPHLADQVEKGFKDCGLNPILVTDRQDKYNGFAASTVALAASGTVALELGMTNTPTVIGYRMGVVSSFLAKRLIKLDHVSLINIVLNRSVMPEYLLENCTPDNLAGALKTLLSSPAERTKQTDAFAQAFFLLSGGDAKKSPSQQAADVVMSMLS